MQNPITLEIDKIFNKIDKIAKKGNFSLFEKIIKIVNKEDSDIN